MASVGDLTISLILNSSQFQQQTTAATGQLGALNKSAQVTNSTFSQGAASLAKWAVGMGAIAIGLRTVKSLLVDSVTAYFEMETSNRKLTAALDGSYEAFKRLDGVANDWQSRVGINDEAIKDQMTFLAAQNRSEEQIRKIIDAAIEYSAATGKTMPDAVKELDKTMEGFTGRLGMTDKRIGALTKEQLENGAAVDLIHEKYKGFADTLGQTAEGKVRRFQAAVADMYEGIGQGLIESFASEIDVLSESLLGASGNAGSLGKRLGEGIVFILKWATIWGLVLTVAKGVKTTLGLLGVSIKDIGRAVVQANKDIANLPSKLPVIGQFYDRIKNKANEYLLKLKEIVGWQDAMTAMGDDAKQGTRFGGKTKEHEANSPSDVKSGTTKSGSIEKEIIELDEVAQKREELAKIEAKYNDAVEKKYIGLTVKYGLEIKALKKEIDELINGYKELNGVSRTAGTPELARGPGDMAQGTSRPGARPIPGIAPDEDAWKKHWTEGINFATQIVNILNRKPETLFDSFMQLLAMATAISMLVNPAVGGLFGAVTGLIGGIGSLFGFAEGGYTGKGGKYQVAGVVHKGEYVVPAHALTPKLFAMLEGLRSNKSFSSAINSYAGGGFVQGSSGGIIQIIQDGVINETVATKIIRKGMPGFNIIMAKKGVR